MTRRSSGPGSPASCGPGTSRSSGQAGDGDEAIQRARETRPDVVFMDIRMPRRNGLEATRAIKAEMPDVKIVILTVSDDEEDLFEAIKSGAEGYLLKNLREEELASFVARLKAGDPAISSGLARSLLREFARLREAVREDEGLTDREQEVLQMVARGATNREIATALFISENTVNYHMKHILARLHLRNRAQVAAWARERGYLSSSPGLRRPSDAGRALPRAEGTAGACLSCCLSPQGAGLTAWHVYRDRL